MVLTPDIRLYLFFLTFATVNVGNGGIGIFASQIIQLFGFSADRSALLGMCQGAAEVTGVAIGTVMFVKLKRRDIPSVFGSIVAICGAVMLIAVPHSMKITQMAGMFAWLAHPHATGLSLVFFYPVSYPMIYSWQSSAVSGTTKRIVFNASLQVAYCAGNVRSCVLSPLTTGRRANRIQSERRPWWLCSWQDRVDRHVWRISRVRMQPYVRALGLEPPP